jgi:hypothetical protein
MPDAQQLRPAWLRPPEQRAGRVTASARRPRVDSDDRDHERDPAGHIPSFNFAFQCVLGRKIGAAVVDRSSEPIKCLRSPEDLSHGQFEEARLTGATRVTLIAGSL